MSEDERLVIIPFDQVLYRIVDLVKNFAVIYVYDLGQVPDFKQMYEPYDPVLEDKQELIDIIETIYRGAKKGRGLVVNHKDYSTRYRY
ncbi:thioredoxin-like protein 4A [Halenospora varia]|nr:thioredoxin-like protein 4A [Halenospora varia]